MSDGTPARYVPDERKYDDKDWLYEKYWGEMRTQQDLADECDVSRRVIMCRMREFGVPTRKGNWKARVGGYDPRDDFEIVEDEGADLSSWATEGEPDEDIEIDWSEF